MAYFNRDNRSSGGRGGSFRRNDFGGRGGDRGDRQMFDAVCSNCGKNCQVPFRPTGDKPVYCSDCFEKMGGRGDRQSSDRPRFEDRRPGFDQNKGQFEAINSKLDKIVALLETPTAPKPKKIVKKKASVKKE